MCNVQKMVLSHPFSFFPVLTFSVCFLFHSVPWTLKWMVSMSNTIIWYMIHLNNHLSLINMCLIFLYFPGLIADFCLSLYSTVWMFHSIHSSTERHVVIGALSLIIMSKVVTNYKYLCVCFPVDIHFQLVWGNIKNLWVFCVEKGNVLKHWAISSDLILFLLRFFGYFCLG